jgi:hypothetical protein
MMVDAPKTCETMNPAQHDWVFFAGVVAKAVEAAELAGEGHFALGDALCAAHEALQQMAENGRYQRTRP